MNSGDLVASFQDTITISESSALKAVTRKAAASSKVYLEGFVAKNRTSHLSAKISVVEDTTFAAARKFSSGGKTAVLNFANPVTPGGGAQNGAMAQEECLCRSSNLYVCLTAFPFADYYQYHRKLHDRFYSDRLIYTHGVTVFKTDDDIPRLMPEHDWFQVDVITCAAPYIAKRKYTNKTALKALFKKRIKNIFEAAVENGVTTLILGAFGCGAFRNPPELVAAAFQEVIEENRYEESFEQIVFAIKKTGKQENYEAFRGAFLPLTVNCPQYYFEKVLLPTGKEIPETTVTFANAPANTTIDAVKEWIAAGQGSFTGWSGQEAHYKLRTGFIKWQVNNPFYKKQISILGDSISTLEGYNPKGYNLFYKGEVCDKTGVHEMRDTWWGKVIDYIGGELLVNNSWSGSRVSRVPNRDALFPSGCSDERTGGLHINEIMPDVIFVYLGTNDWAYGTRVDEETGNLNEDYTVFSEAYFRMLRRLRDFYPKAEIYCCTLNETFISSRPAFRFPYSHGGIHIEKYNQVIRSASNSVGCKLIELYNRHIPYDSVDGSHPTADGMNTLAVSVLREICDQKGLAFLEGRGEEAVIKNPEMSWIGKQLDGRYEVMAQLGAGSISRVFLARDLRLKNKQWTVKVYNMTGKESKLYRSIILQEFKVMVRFDYPAIPKIIDIIEDEEKLIIVREYIEGKVLSELVKQKGPFKEPDVIYIGLQLAAALNYLHSFDPPYIYRDMKPGNVMLSNSGEVKLIEFGTVIPYSDVHKEYTCILGTKGYAPPEQYSGRVDQRSDIYSLGMTLHHLLTGISPNDPPYITPPVRQVKPEISKGLEYIINKCIELNPDDRYASCAELINDLDHVMDLPPKKGFFSRIFGRK